MCFVGLDAATSFVEAAGVLILLLRLQVVYLQVFSFYFNLQMTMNSDLCCFWIYIGTECMSCSVIAPEDFVLPLLATPQLKERYIRHAFSDYVRSHPELKFCPSPHCNMIIRANENKAKRIVCHSCNAKFWYWIVFFKSAFSFVNNLELIYLVFDVVVNITLRLIAKRFDSGWPSVQMIAKRPTTLQLILKWADLTTF